LAGEGWARRAVGGCWGFRGLRGGEAGGGCGLRGGRIIVGLRA
jgi:hypothetical protein